LSLLFAPISSKRELKKAAMRISKLFKRHYVATLLILHLAVLTVNVYGQQSTEQRSTVPVDTGKQSLLQALLPQKPQLSAKSEGEGVSIRSLVEDAINANPEIVVMRREFDAARARIPQAKSLPDPMVRFGNMNVGSPIPFVRVKDGFNESFFLGFIQEFPWFGVRRMRGLVASSEAEAKFAEYESMVRRLTAEVKSSAYDLYNIDRALVVIKRDIDILNNFVEIAEARYEVGKAQQVDIINARLEITEILEKQGTLEGQRESTVARINNLLFRDPETPISSLAEIKMSPAPPPLNELVSIALESSPDLEQQRRRMDTSRHALRLAEREAKYPEVGFGVVYHKRPDGDPDYYTYELTFKLPLYSFKKQRYAVVEQTANLSASRSRLASTNSLIRYRLRDAYVRATTAARLLRLQEQGILPQATLALESAMAAYQVGQVDFLTLLTALRRAVDVETRYYELLTDYQKALTEMELFVGVELTK
jgi:outer membrane protein, heavy metal efflux system